MGTLPQHDNTAMHRTSQTQIRCIQINLQHSKSATYNLTKTIDSDETDLILIQEPYEYNSKPAGIAKKYRIFTAGTGKHRAAIIITNSSIDAILLTKISDEDTVVLELIYNNLKIYAASMYFDIHDQLGKHFYKIDEIMKTSTNGKILIGADTNARSKTWHDVSTNARGKKLEEFLASAHLHIINEESERKTFHSSIGSSNIDLTIASNNLITEIQDWEISAEESLSDHNYLKFKLCPHSYNHTIKPKNRSIKYIIREGKQQLFARNLVQIMLKKTGMVENEVGAEEIDKVLSTEIATGSDLEQNIQLMEEAIQSACRRTFQHPLTNKRRGNYKSVPWWNVELTVMRQKVNANRRLYQRTKNDEALREKRKATYMEAKRKYKTEIKKARASSWKEYCNVTASLNPWSQVYKLASGKAKTANIMTTIRKPDGTETTSLHETLNAILDYLLTEDSLLDNPHHKTVRRVIEEPIHTNEDVDFSREEVQNAIDSFNPKKAPGLDGLTAGTYKQTFQMFPRTITTIYNQCLKRGCFPKRWKTAKIILVTKPMKDNSLDPSKYRPISLLNIGGKILEKMLINRINHHLYKHDLLSDRQFGFTPQKNTIDATMEAKSFIEPTLYNRGLVILTSLDVQGAFDSAWIPAILQGLRNFNCPSNLYMLSKEYFSNRTAVITTNNSIIERKVTRGCPQGSCCGPTFWNILYNSLLSMELTSHSKAIAFADDLIILTRGETVAEAENYMNIELSKIEEWAQNNKLKFNNTKSKVMPMSWRKRNEKKQIEIYINNKILQQVHSLKYMGIIFDSKLTFRERITYLDGQNLPHCLRRAMYNYRINAY